MPRLLYAYKNGNYRVRLYDDGTKIKQTNDDCFVASFPDSIDLKITDYCENNCPMCHENSSIHGQHADLEHPIIDSFMPGTEIAIGGGNPLTHPNLLPFLQKLKDLKVVANITVNQMDLQKYQSVLKQLISKKLVYGIGISCMSYSQSAVEFARENPNAVLHLIYGVFPAQDYSQLFDTDLKILLLGYKRYGRGEGYFDDRVATNMMETQKILPQILKGFSVVSFDNLALQQLNIKEVIGEDEYNKIYMGDDGEASMYIDLVKQQFAISSTSNTRYALSGSVKDCFRSLQIKK